MEKILRRVSAEFKKICKTDVALVLCFFLSGMGKVLEVFSPFGTACVTGLLSLNFSAFAVLPVAAGNILGGFELVTVKYLLVYLLLIGMSVRRSWFKTPKTRKTATAAALVTAYILYGAFTEFHVYYWLTSASEIVLILFLIEPYCTVINYFSTRAFRRTATEKDLFSLCVTACGCLSGLSEVSLPGDVQLAGILCTFILFFCAYNFSFPVCGILGTVLGLFASLANPELLYSVGSYSVAALVCCACKNYGKSGIVLGFILSNAVMTFYINGSEAVLINIFEILIAGGIFMCIPHAKLKEMRKNILVLTKRKQYHQTKSAEEVKNMTVKRLHKVADAFCVLAASMRKTGKKQWKNEQEIIGVLTENGYTRTCGVCERRQSCVQAGENAKAELRALFLKNIKRGWAEPYDVSASFKNSCLHADRMVLEANKVYELYRVNTVWENRIAENRELIAHQLQDVSGVMQSLAKEISEEFTFEEKAEKQIIAVLDGLGVRISNVSLVRDINNRLSAEVGVLNCKGRMLCEHEIKTVLKKATGKSFVHKKEACNREKCTVCYREEENFKAEIGVARRRPSAERMFGDSYAIIHPRDGQVMVALSDGMGVGSRAAGESRETLSLLEHLLMAGIERQTAIKLINSVLILKSYDESFATLDLLILDLFTGEGELIKTGSACSYICRGNEVAVVSASALPTGIIGDMETASKRIRFCEGDVILLASDGVTDVSLDDKWISDKLIALQKQDAQIAADAIMEAAMRKAESCKDDMTVLLIKISEK